MSHHGVNGNWLAVLVSVVAFSILGITLLVSMLDARLQARTSQLASSLAEANRELAQLALHDTLTRLPNRVLLEDRLDQAINKARREGSFFALMFMDWTALKPLTTPMGTTWAINCWLQWLIVSSSNSKGNLRWLVWG